MNRNETLDHARHLGLDVGTYSPGDGVTRYRAWERGTAHAYDYFSAPHPLYTALGLAEFRVWLAGYAAGRTSL